VARGGERIQRHGANADRAVSEAEDTDHTRRLSPQAVRQGAGARMRSRCGGRYVREGYAFIDMTPSGNVLDMSRGGSDDRLLDDGDGQRGRTGCRASVHADPEIDLAGRFEFSLRVTASNLIMLFSGLATFFRLGGIPPVLPPQAQSVATLVLIVHAA
jgi:hypothetical protein